MATLSDVDRKRIWAGLMRWWSNLLEAQPWLKAQLRDAVNATDDWIEANQLSYNQALPQPFRGVATDAQKTLLFCVVAAARVSIAFLRMLVGEVD